MESLVVENVATPADNPTDPIGVAPSRKATVPPGKVVPVAGFTAAVNVMLEPAEMLVLEADNDTVVSTIAAVTLMDTAEDFDGLKLDEPA